MRNGIGRLLFVCAMLVDLCYGQTGAGQIQGTVTGSSGAVIPNVKVALDSVQTGNRFDSTTNSVGLYVFPSLQPGEYKVSITAPGLQNWESQLLLRAGQQAVVNAALALARANEQVTVVGDVTPLVTTSSATLATVVERARVEQLPLNGRSVQTLLSITVPGLEGAAAQPRVYGLRDSAMEISQDGVPLDDRNTGSLQNLDAFDVFNQPGLVLPSSDGIISLRTSAQAARTMQYTARIIW